MYERLARLEGIVEQINVLEAERIRQEATGYKPVLRMRPDDCRDVMEIFEVLRVQQDPTTKVVGQILADSLYERARTDQIYAVGKKYGDILRQAAEVIREICR